MTRRLRFFLLPCFALMLAHAGCSTSTLTSMAAQSLFSQMGGSSSMSKLASGMLSSSAKDPRLSGLFSGADMSAVQPKLSNQLCATLGGGCTAPLTNDQIEQGADKLTPTQTEAVGQNFGTSLGGMGLSSTLTDSVMKAVGPKLPGILGALL